MRLPSHASSRWLRPALIGGALLLAAILIFARLGHYTFWDDEAGTALSAKAILRTGRNTALIDHGNVVAYSDGNALHGFNNHIEALLPSYLAAASFALFGLQPWAGRLPFALLGLGTFALILFWARHENPRVLAILAIGLIGNVSLILFVRNCRYYAPTIFFSVALAYLYCRRRPTPGNAAAFAGLSILLLTSNYLDFVAFYACLFVDYLVWQRGRSPLGWRTLFCLFVPQLVVGGLIAVFWNPLQTAHGDNVWQTHLWSKCLLFYAQWRDVNRCEFLCLPLLPVTLALGLAQRRPLLVRGCVAIAVYLTMLTLVSPQAMTPELNADVRYLTPVIPLAVALETATICLLFKGRALLQFGAAVLLFGTNFFNGGMFFRDGARSTLGSYLEELRHPPADPYTPAAAWIDAHVPDGGSVWVMPNTTAYPLMVRAPRALYAWQFAYPPRPGYASLPSIHFLGEVPPDYLVAFGPYLPAMTQSIQYMNQMNGTAVGYGQVAVINVFWNELYRPELFLHGFESVTGFTPGEAIHIFKRTSPPAPPDRAMGE